MKTNLEERARRVARRAPWRVRPGGDSPPACPEGQTVGPPDFVGVGVQKAGTSWWFSLLSRHPGVFHPPRVHKERHYFNRFWQEPFDEAARTGYAKWFPRPSGYLTGEWTPRYMADFWTPPLIRASAPNAKILILLRDPLERYLSALTHHLRRGAPPTPDLAALAASRGLYHDQLRHVLGHFPTTQVLLLQYERCREDPAGQLEQTHTFLGLEAVRPHGLTDPVGRTPIDKPRLDPQLHAALVEFFLPDVKRLIAEFPEIDVGLWPNFSSLL